MDISPEKRERILDAAAHLIVENGLQSSMSAIAERAGVATGSLYNYFASKQDMVWAVYERLAHAINEALIREIDPAVPHKQRFMTYVSDYVDFIWADRERAVLFEYLSNVPLITNSQMKDVFSGSGKYIDTLIIEAQGDGVVRGYSPLLIGALIGGSIRNTLKWRRMQPGDLTLEERDQIATMCWDAIAASDGR
jgi:AcrR family transcriptional regulator